MSASSSHLFYFHVLFLCTRAVWCVNKQAEEWAGKLDPNFEDTEARYQWIWHQTGDDCVVKMSCGKNGDPNDV